MASQKIENIDKIQREIAESERLYPEELLDNPSLEYEQYLSKKAFIWKATKEGSADIYLLGTLHKSNKDLYQIFKEQINLILQNIGAVLTEIRLERNESFIFQRFLKGGSDYVYEFDSDIVTVAASLNKIINPLENDTVRQLIAKKTLDYSEKLQNDLHFNSNFNLNEATTRYLNLNIGENITSLEPELNKEIQKRNKYWMRKILLYSNSGAKTLVVCGLSHLCGKGSLVHLLLTKGYELTPIIDKAPESKQTITQVPQYQPANRYNSFSTSSVSWISRTYNDQTNQEENKVELIEPPKAYTK